MERPRGWGPFVAALLLVAAAAACAKKNIDAASEVAGAVRWYAGVTVEQLLPLVQEIFEENGYRVATVDTEAGRIETEWGPEFPGGLRGWRLTRWSERQKFIALVSPSQFQTERGNRWSARSFGFGGRNALPVARGGSRKRGAPPRRTPYSSVSSANWTIGQPRSALAGTDRAERAATGPGAIG